MNLPTWLTPGTLAACDSTLFAVAKVQRAKPPAKDVVLVAANGDRFPLALCCQAHLLTLAKACRFIDAAGTEVALSVVGDRVIISDLAFNEIRRVCIPGLTEAADVDAAAQSFARAFNGVIVEGLEDAV